MWGVAPMTATLLQPPPAAFHPDQPRGDDGKWIGAGLPDAGLFDWDEYERSYDRHDERNLDSGFTAVVMTNGDTQLAYDDPDDPDHRYVIRDMGAAEMRDLADVVERVLDSEPGSDGEHFGDGGDVHLSLDPVGDLHLEFVDENDETAEFDIGADDGAELVDAMREVADMSDELADGDLGSGATTATAGTEPGRRARVRTSARQAGDGRRGRTAETAPAVHHLDNANAGADTAEHLAAFRARMRRPVARQGHAWYRIRNTAAGEAEIFLFDEIGFWGTSAEQFVDELKALGASRITVRINSPGGDVADGLAIYNALRAHPAHVTTCVDGLAASAASFIFQAGDRRVTARNGILMIHDALSLWYGNAADMRKCADLLDKLSDNIADIYAQRGGGDVAAWRALMLAETWFTGAEAVAAGLADEMTDPDPAPVDAPPEMGNSWDLTVFRYAGRDQAPEPGVARAANAADGSGGEPGADAAGGAVEPPPESTPEPAPAAPEPPAEPVVDDTPAPLVPDPPADTTQDDWADIVAQLETAPSTVDDALVRLREA